MSPRTARLVTAVTSGLIAVAVALGVTWFVLGNSLHHKQAAFTARDQALAVARQVAVNINSYDYDKLDQQFDRVRHQLTGRALDDFTTNEAAIRKQLTSNKEHAVAQVLDAATVGSSRDEATELIGLAITFTTPSGRAGPTTSYAQVHLVRNQGHWIVDTFQGVA